jgi:hypothetical protein
VRGVRGGHHQARSIFRRRRVNLVVFPGSALPYKEDWQATANRLPANGVLIVLPSHGASQKESLLSLAKSLAVTGHQVRVVPEAQLPGTLQQNRASTSTRKHHDA